MARRSKVSILVEIRERGARILRGLQTGFRKLRGLLIGPAGIAGAIGTVFGGIGLASIIKVGDETENLRLRLNALLGSVEEGGKAFEKMAAFAASVPFEYREIMEAATQLAGVVEGGSDEIAELMPLIADLAAVSGIGIRETTEQVVRMFAAGAASADRFRERGITAMLGFEAGVSVSAEETKRRVIAAWEDSESKFRGAANNMAATWSGITSMLSDRWFQFRQKIADAGLFDAVKEKASDFLAWLDAKVEDGSFDAWAEGISDAALRAIESIETLVMVLKDLAIALDLFGIQQRLANAEVEKNIRDRIKTEDDFLTELDRITRGHETNQIRAEELRKLAAQKRKEALEIMKSAAESSRPAAGVDPVARAILDRAIAYESEADHLDRVVAGYKRQVTVASEAWAAIRKVGDESEGAGEAGETAGRKIGKLPAEARKAFKEYQDAVAELEATEAALGPRFDETEARAKLLTETIEKLAATGVPLTAAFDAAGTSVQSLKADLAAAILELERVDRPADLRVPVLPDGERLVAQTQEVLTRGPGARGSFLIPVKVELATPGLDAFMEGPSFGDAFGFLEGLEEMVRGPTDALSNMFGGPADNAERFGQHLIDITSGLVAVQTQALIVNDLLVGFTGAFEEAVTSWVDGSKSMGEAFAGAMLNAVASAASAQSKFYAAKAIAAVGEGILGDPRGFAAAAKFTAASIAFAGIAGALRGAAGGIGGGASGAGAAVTGAREAAGSARQGDITLIIEGDPLFETPRSKERLRKVLEDASGRRVRTIHRRQLGTG